MEYQTLVGDYKASNGNDHLERIERLEKNVECIKQYIENVKISR